MYSVYNVVVFGTGILLLYIIIDLIKNRTRNILRRIIFYSFVFYLLNVIQLITGGIVIPPQKDFGSTTQLIPFYFIGDLFNMYRDGGVDWHFWNSFKLTFFNFIMLMPLGIYLFILFRMRGKLKAFLIIVLVSFMIEVIQLTLGYLGLIMGRGFNIDDLIVNTLGGLIAFGLCKLIIDFVLSIYENQGYVK